jgi:lipooligosaccharide transport system permease protein
MSTTAVDAGWERPAVREGFEFRAMAGVWRRHLILYRRFWHSTTVSATLDPTIQLLAMGLGIGSLVAVVGGHPYIEFLGTGLVATAVLFGSIMPGMYDTFVLREFMKMYDGVLAAPLGIAELVLGDATWLAARTGVYSCTPMLIAMLFGLQPTWGMLVVPFVAALSGLGFALLGIWVSTIVPSFDTFNYVNSGLVTPLFLVSGTFFPLDRLPDWTHWITVFNPVYHCIQLVRDAAFGFHAGADLLHALALAIFAALTGTLAVRGQRRKLID